MSNEIGLKKGEESDQKPGFLLRLRRPDADRAVKTSLRKASDTPPFADRRAAEKKHFLRYKTHNCIYVSFLLY